MLVVSDDATERIPSTNPIIEAFVNDQYSKAAAGELANRVKEMCQNDLGEIQAIVTCRPKELKSLATKLDKLDDDKLSKDGVRFQTKKEIEENIFDLSGVRIALYVPSQKDDVVRMIERLFGTVVWKPKRGKVSGKVICESCRTTESGTETTAIGPDRDDSYTPVFAGYKADHARVKLHRKDRKGLVQWNTNYFVEIQIVSVLLHVWAEVEHDITYKSIKARAGKQERLILDALNGMILSSELLLDQLHSIHEKRVDDLKKGFQKKHDLANFLGNYADDLLADERANGIDLEMLLGLLNAVNKNSQKALTTILENLGFNADYSVWDEDLQKRISASVKRFGPFPLPQHMHIPFYIMNHILDQLSQEDKRVTQEKVEKGCSENAKEYSGKCRILLSSFIWLRDLAPGSSIPSALACGEMGEDEREAYKWACTGMKRYDILDGEEPATKDRESLDRLWDWFEKQSEDSFIAFVFKVSRLGVLKDSPTQHLSKADMMFDVPDRDSGDSGESGDDSDDSGD